MENSSSKKALLGAITVVVIGSNAISLVTTAMGLKASFFQANTLVNTIFVVALSATIQLLKASLDRVSDRPIPLWAIAFAALVLSSCFSAQAFISAAYPITRFSEVARQTLSSSYTKELLDIKNAVGNELSNSRDSLWNNLENIRSSLHAEDAQQTALSGLSSSMLDKYTEDGSWIPMQDSYYVSLARVLSSIEAGDYDSAKAEAQAAYDQLKAEDLSRNLEQIAARIDLFRQQLKQVGSQDAGLKASLLSQLDTALEQQEMLQSRYAEHELLKLDFQTVLRAFGLADRGDAKAADSLDKLENELLQSRQDSDLIRASPDDINTNANSAEMDLQSISMLYAQVDNYLSLLDSNTFLSNCINELPQLPTEEAAAESWADFWQSKVTALKQKVAAASLSDTKQQQKCINKLNRLIRRYTTTEHTPMEYAVICLASSGNGLAIFCCIIAILLDLSGFAAFTVAKRVL